VATSRNLVARLTIRSVNSLTCRRSPLCKSSGTASHYVRRTGQTAVGAHVPDQLTGSNRYYSVAAENGFDVPSCDDNGLGYLLPLFENNLPGRAVDQPGKADQPYRSSRLSIELNATL
jgi:hypothetical protein